jgi:hypothetical protein
MATTTFVVGLAVCLDEKDKSWQLTLPDTQEKEGGRVPKFVAA